MAATITGSGGYGLISSATAQGSTSGTAIDFGSIPAGVKRITVMLNGVSWSGTANLLIQIGSGSVTTTGYVSSSSQIYSTAAIQTSATNGFVVFSNLASNLFYGAMEIRNITGNTWNESGTFSLNTGATATAGGGVALGGTLDRVRITTSNGTDTFDAGTINIFYE